jgi:hypothetical protein
VEAGRKSTSPSEIQEVGSAVALMRKERKLKLD